jgi:hypothetical protein
MTSVPFDETMMIETAGDGVLAPPSTRAQVEALAQRAAQCGHLVVHLHGGLVSSALGRISASALSPTYAAAKAFPVAFIWNTHPIDIVLGNWREILDEAFFERVLEIVVRWTVGRFKRTEGGKSTSGFDNPSDLEVREELRTRTNEHEPYEGVGGVTEELSREDVKAFEAAVARDRRLVEVTAAIVGADAGAKGGAAGPRVATRMDPEVLQELAGEEGSKGVLSIVALAKHAAAVLRRVISRFVRGRDHGVYATCVEEIGREFYVAAVGTKLWTMIKQEAADTFADGERGGRVFVDALAAAAVTHGRPRITVVGHSAGSIYACHLVVELAKKGFQVDDLVLLAAAVRYDVFAERMAAAAALLGGPPVRRFHLIALDDACERGYWEIPLLYPRSLLYLVSGAAETIPDEPLLGMERFWTSEALAKGEDVRRILAKAKLHWLAPLADGKVYRHGGLFSPTDSPAVVEMLARILAEET